MYRTCVCVHVGVHKYVLQMCACARVDVQVNPFASRAPGLPTTPSTEMGRSRPCQVREMKNGKGRRERRNRHFLLVGLNPQRYVKL